MRNIIKRFALVAPALMAALATTPASAHPGSHMEFSASAVMQHLLSSPYHMGLAVGAALSLAVVIWKVSTANKSGLNSNPK